MAWLLDPAAALYATIVQLADKLPGTPIHAPAAPPGFALGLAALVAMAVLLCRPHRCGIAAAAVVCCLPFFVPLASQQPPALQLLAVGHGQAALVRLPGGAQIAIDCGSQQVPLRAARRMVEHLPVRRLDLLVITHGDHDHTSGLPWLLQRIAIKRAVLPGILRHSPVATLLADHAVAVQWLAPGEQLQALPGLDVHAPRLATTASGNDQSLWVHLDLGSATALLSGDAEAAGIASAIAQGFVRPVDLLVLPHHGRPTPMAGPLLAATRPLACFASAACADGETALGPATRSAGSDLWVTGLHGDLELLATTPPRVRSQIDGRPLVRRRP
jgi:competence protein ComEC